MPNHNWASRQPVYASLSPGTPSSLNVPPSPPSFTLRPDQYVHVRPLDPTAPLGTFEHPFPYGYVHSEEGKKETKGMSMPPPSQAPPAQAPDADIRCTKCTYHRAQSPPAAVDEADSQQPTLSASSSTTSFTSPPSTPQPAPRRKVRFDVSENYRPSDRSIPSSPHPSRPSFGSPSTDHAKGRVVPPPTTRGVPLPTTRVAPTLITRMVPLPTNQQPPTRPTHPGIPQHNPRCILCEASPAIASASEPSLAFCEGCWDEAERAEVER